MCRNISAKGPLNCEESQQSGSGLGSDCKMLTGYWLRLRDFTSFTMNTSLTFYHCPIKLIFIKYKIILIKFNGFCQTQSQIDFCQERLSTFNIFEDVHNILIFSLKVSQAGVGIIVTEASYLDKMS